MTRYCVNLGRPHDPAPASPPCRPEVREVSHTPGPWKIYLRGGKHINGANISDGKINVCRMPYAADRAIDQKEADALLISTAPGLLEVARMAALETYPRGHRSKLLRASRAAIAKAEGTA